MRGLGTSTEISFAKLKIDYKKVMGHKDPLSYLILSNLALELRS